ncbi:hypothetical protein GGX14DRAFT_399184 [Mycena pura]|uniref:Uncharacterized protein n=1 Tax=Mycena pura TaxID=153505 RepID=A0AAD6V5M2_9AGAR|nr:hypothetical protein GGX14DRAFT_399184 [Mycena pura]
MGDILSAPKGSSLCYLRVGFFVTFGSQEISTFTVVQIITIPTVIPPVKAAICGLYEGLLHRSKPELKAAEVTDLVKLLDNIAYAGDEVFVDFEGLYKRLRDTSNDYLELLQDLDSAYALLIERVVPTVSACDIYLNFCRCALDPTLTPLSRTGALYTNPDRGIALQKVHEQTGKLRASIASTAECWKKTGHLLRYELASNLPMLRGLEWVLRAELFIFPNRRDSQRYTLHADLSAHVTNARWHLAKFGQLLESLEDTMKQIESGFESGESNETVRQTIHANAPLVNIMVLFASFRFSLLHRPSPTTSVFDLNW